MSTDNNDQKQALSSKSSMPEQFANQALILQQNHEPITDTTGVKITELQSDNNNNYNHFTGTNGKIVFRKIGLETYNGPKQEDFFALAKSYYDVTIETLEALEKTEQNTSKVKKIQEKKAQFNDEIKVLFPNIPPAKQPTVEKLSENIDIAAQKLNTLVGNFAFLIEYDEKADTDKSTLQESIEKRGHILREAVKQNIQKDGRSNSYHLYEVPGGEYN